MECPEVYESVSEADEIRIDLAAGEIHHHGRTYHFPQFPPSMQKLLEVGGLAEYLKSLQL